MSVLDNLDWISQELVEAGDNVDVRVADDVLNETSSMGARYLTEMLNRVEDAVAELETIRARYQQVAATLENTPIPKKALDEHPPHLWGMCSQGLSRTLQTLQKCAH